MEVSLNEALDVIFEEESRGEASSFNKKKIDTQKYEDFIKIIKGEKEFEGDIDGPDDMRAIIRAIKDINKELKDKSTSGGESSLRKRLSQYYNKALTIEKIVDKIDAGKKITSKEEQEFEDFADEIEDSLFQETYMKQLFPDETNTSSSDWDRNIYGAFPIKYTSPKGKDYYAIVRPPTGVVTWEGMSLSKDGATSEIREILKRDPKISIGPRFDEYDKDSKKIFKGTKSVKEMLDTGRLKIKDDDKTKEKVEKAFFDNGVEAGTRGYIKGINKALKDINFWKEIKNLF